MPVGAKGDEATAAYKDGVLTITVPVPWTKTGTRTIPVQHG
ncbi:Hsp20 family protein [Streptomyces galilaeus]